MEIARKEGKEVARKERKEVARNIVRIRKGVEMRDKSYEGAMDLI